MEIPIFYRCNPLKVNCKFKEISIKNKKFHVEFNELMKKFDGLKLSKNMKNSKVGDDKSYKKLL